MTVAENAAAGPNYIFPMMGGAYFSVANFQLIYLMFRPLYWFGSGYTPDLNPGLSVAYAPVYSNGGKTVAVKMKGYKWSNGETVNAQDVVFWMNMMKADATSWAAYVPGPGQYPGDITNVVANNTTDTVTFTLDSAYSQYWFTYNELSQITPLPTAWDVTSAGAAPGSGGCSRAVYSSITTAMSSTGTFSKHRLPPRPVLRCTPFSRTRTKPVTSAPTPRTRSGRSSTGRFDSAPTTRRTMGQPSCRTRSTQAR